MSSYFEKECSSLPDPGWVAVLIAYCAYPKSTRVRFDDASLEWGRGSHNLRFSTGTRNIGNKMMPLGFMITRYLFDLAKDFMRAFDVDIHAPCVWIDCRPYTPVQLVRYDKSHYHWAAFLWKAGVSAAEFMSNDFFLRGGARFSLVLKYREKEHALTALAWTCDQIAGTAWSDCAEPVVKRMRQGEE